MLNFEFRDLSNAVVLGTATRASTGFPICLDCATRIAGHAGVELGALGLIVTAARAVIEAAAPLLKGSAPLAFARAFGRRLAGQVTAEFDSASKKMRQDICGGETGQTLCIHESVVPRDAAALDGESVLPREAAALNGKNAATIEEDLVVTDDSEVIIDALQKKLAMLELKENACESRNTGLQQNIHELKRIVNAMLPFVCHEGVKTYVERAMEIDGTRYTMKGASVYAARLAELHGNKLMAEFPESVTDLIDELKKISSTSSHATRAPRAGEHFQMTIFAMENAPTVSGDHTAVCYFVSVVLHNL